MTNETQADRLAEVLRLLDLIDTAHEHGDECAIVEQAVTAREALQTLSTDLAKAEAAVHKAIAWFDEYADQHERKATETSNVGETLDRLEKAKRNKVRADELRAALHPSKERA